ncbi:MAG: ABC transporter permease [Anaerolineales bacterium]|jgi:peptide/nickel transport system permease protein
MVPLLNRPRIQLLTVIGRRLIEGLLTAWAAVTITFFALRIAGGDPAENLLAQGLATVEQAQALRQRLGLDRPLGVQYLDFLGDLVHGDFGLSLYTSRPVARVISEQLPYTLTLALVGLSIALLLGFSLGIIAAWHENRFDGRAAAVLSDISTALPVAFMGVLLLYATLLLSSASGLPISGTNLLLPALVLGIATTGPIGRIVQAGLRESLRSEYILAARARGLRSGLRLFWHAFRPALSPVISLIALEAAYLFSGTVVTETVFSRPGLGRLLVKSILESDFPVAQALVVLAALFYTVSHVLADVGAIMLDPRRRRTG